ncbi:hypothetical protein NGM07_00085 [Halorussus vallis]|uniref:fibronectin type III domain-containing protein n=1 Tax=Halorussus vallis TaxID=2953749 RepID=UPI00209F6438|nr:hypothetical protein [Halorussus vallis]USZ75744.1 hypothetical protein NGM07_00085 [Halorussus vallis]
MVVIDNFEDGDTSAYTQHWNDEKFNASTSRVYSGTYSGHVNADTDGGGIYYSSRGLPNYPPKGSTFSGYFNHAGQYNRLGVLFGGSSVNGCYEVHVTPQYDNIYIFDRTGSSVNSRTMLASANATIPDTHGWFKIEVDWQDTITARVYNQSGALAGEVSVTDSRYSTGGFGFYFEGGSSNVNFYTDYWTYSAPPAAPSNLAASATADDVSLSWDDNSNNEDGFRIERAHDGSGFSEIATVNAGVTTYDDPNVLDGELYTYRVRAYNASGTSSYSNEDSATTSLSAPSGASQTVDTPTAITLSFTDNTDNETSFRVEKSVDGGAWTHVTDLSANTTSQQFTVSKSADTFQWRIRAETEHTTSGWATTGTAATDGSGLTATVASGTKIDLGWDAKPDADEYHLYRAQASSSSLADYTQIATIAAGTTTHSDTGLESGEEYHYRLAPVYGTTEDNPSVNVAATTSLPAASGVTLDTSTQNEIGVSWTRNDNSSDGVWEIYRSTDGSLGTLQTTISTLSTTSWTDTPVPDGEKYYYTIRRVTDHASADSSQVSATTILPAPVIDSLTVSGDQFEVAFQDRSDNEDEFRVYLRPTGTASWTFDGTAAADATSYTTTSQRDGEEYELKVAAYTEDAESDSGVVTATTDLPDAQTPSLDNGIEDEITATWPDVIDYGNYRLRYRQTDVSTWTDWGTVGEAMTSATIRGLPDGEEFEVQLRTETEHTPGRGRRVRRLSRHSPRRRIRPRPSRQRSRPRSPGANSPTTRTASASTELESTTTAGGRGWRSARSTRTSRRSPTTR